MLSVWLETHLYMPATKPSLPILLSPLKYNTSFWDVQCTTAYSSWLLAFKNLLCSWVLCSAWRHLKAAGVLIWAPRWETTSLESAIWLQILACQAVSRYSRSSMLRCLWQLLWFQKFLSPNLHSLWPPQLCWFQIRSVKSLFIKTKTLAGGGCVWGK